MSVFVGANVSEALKGQKGSHKNEQTGDCFAFTFLASKLGQNGFPYLMPLTRPTNKATFVGLCGDPLVHSKL